MAPLHPVHGSPGVMKTPAKIRFSENSDPNLPGQSRPQKPAFSPAAKPAKEKNENSDPNLPGGSPLQKSVLDTPATKSARAKKSVPKISCSIVSPPPAVQERKFIVAKKKTKGATKDRDLKQCRQVAYEALRASQDNFFRKDLAAAADGSSDALEGEEGKRKGEEQEQEDRVVENEGQEEQKDRAIEDKGNPRPDQIVSADDSGHPNPEGTPRVRKMSLTMEEAMDGIPEPGSGRVLHLVKAFESLLSIPKDGEVDRVAENKKVTNWASLGLWLPPQAGASEAASSSSVFSSMEFFFPPRDLERDSRVRSSFDSNDRRLTFGSDKSGLGRRSRRNSSESLRSSWNKKLRVTRQHPFKLRTEQRGRLKEEYFLNKVREMLMDEEKRRIPIAQGVPWTTDEPECLVKPPVKEITEPVDLVLYSDVRAVERAAFDHYVAERMTFVEQMKLERERQQKLEEEEGIKKLRKELVPKAQPMPYFDRPFVPKKSTRPQTVPKEPRFHVRPNRACDTTSLC